MAEPPPVPDALVGWLQTAQELGILGPGPVQAHVEHAARFLWAIGVDFSGTAVDLGSGAGVPGLMLAVWWPASRWQLVDGSEKRAAALTRAVATLDLGDRVTATWGRAEVLAHETAHREVYDLVVARSFGPPAVVAECAAGFLRIGGELAVSEPPTDQQATSRWSDAVAAELGLALEPARAGIQLLDKVAPTPSRYPRRVGVPAKRPLT